MSLSKMLLCLVFCASAGSVFSQNQDSLTLEDISRKSIVLPRPYRLFEVKTSASLLFTRLPIDWIEITADVPILQLNAVVGLPKGFSMNASVQTVYFTTQARIGPRWSYSFQKFSAGVGLDIAWMFGNMNVYDFNSKASAFLYYPHLAIGFHTDDIAFTLTGELNYAASLKISSGKAEITRVKQFFAGHSIGFFIEQLLWKKTLMIIGFTVYHHRFFYPAWPAFTSLTRYYLIPQLNIGLII